jgi:hypothetical protein
MMDNRQPLRFCQGLADLSLEFEKLHFGFFYHSTILSFIDV